MPGDVFNKRIVLNHDKYIKSDRYLKYESRRFKYVMPTDTIGVETSKYLDLLRGFIYPTVLVVAGNLKRGVVWGEYNNEIMNGLRSLIPVGCRETQKIEYWNENIFKLLLGEYRCYISFEDATSRTEDLSTILGKYPASIKTVDTALIHVSYYPRRSEPEKHLDEGNL
jgi:hypothetical protein